MKKSFKIFSVFLFVLVLMSVLLSVPASALTVGGGATVEGYQAFVIGGGLETELMQIRELNEYKINFAFRALEFPYYSSTVQTVANFLFKPSINDYGTLEFTYTLSNNNGLLNADSSAWQQVGLFDGATGKKLANATVSGTELKFSYTGHIPSRFYVVGYYYFTVPETSQDAIISSYAFKFTPIDKGAQDIIDNQNENTDKILNGWQGSSPSSGNTGDLDSAESSLLDQVTGSNPSLDAISTLSSLVIDFQPAFAAVSAMYQDMVNTSVPGLGVLVWASIVIGIVPLIVGMSISGLRQRDSLNAIKSHRNNKKG